MTEDLVRKASEDFVKVVLDFNGSKKKKRSEVDTGLFTRIYKAKPLDKKIDYFNLDLSVQGTKLKNSRFKKICRNEDRKFHKSIAEAPETN